MLVIVVHTAGISAEHLVWAGRRHDDDGTESTGAQSAGGLFDAVFHALHDGEQVAIGFDCPLVVALDGVDPTTPTVAVERARSVDAGPGVEQLRRLVDQLGQWRPWTIVTTSLLRWRATTSVLLWEVSMTTSVASVAAAIDAFYVMVQGTDQPGFEDAHRSLINLAAVAAVDSEVTTDPAEATRPVLRIAVRAPSVATA